MQGKTRIFEKPPAKERAGVDTKILEQLEACFCQEIDLAGCDFSSGR
jgi:hypothetical protein